MAESFRKSFTNGTLIASLTSCLSRTDWRMQLNNYLQANGGSRLLSWDVFQSGPLHQPSWTAIAYSMFRTIYVSIASGD